MLLIGEMIAIFCTMHVPIGEKKLKKRERNVKGSKVCSNISAVRYKSTVHCVQWGNSQEAQLLGVERNFDTTE